MNGPDHYRAAQRLLSDASYQVSPRNPRPTTPSGTQIPAEQHHALILRAIGHGLLAAAAAIIDSAYEIDDSQAWRDAQQDGQPKAKPEGGEPA